jgi:hypothetical protein
MAWINRIAAGMLCSRKTTSINQGSTITAEWLPYVCAHQAIGLSAAAGVGSSCHSPILLQQRNHISDSPGVDGGGVELVSELDKIALSLALSSASRAFSLFSCFICSCAAARRLSSAARPRSRAAHSLLVLDLSPIELDLSQLVVDNGSPVEHRQQAAEPGQGGVVLRFADRGRRRRGRGCGHGCTTRKE